MGPVYHLLGLSVGVIQSMGGPGDELVPVRPHYTAADDRYQHLRNPCTPGRGLSADITYGTNNEFGFDYLRDNMVWDLSQCVQRELYYAIVDEVDNILIDEARTPLIISGEAEESASKYQRFARIVGTLRPEIDYVRWTKSSASSPSPRRASTKVERALGIDNIYAPEHFELTPYLENALKAQALFHRDRDYIVPMAR
jgi:preprotein translocase subunit SecA